MTAPFSVEECVALLVGLSKDLEDWSLQESIRRECVDDSDSRRVFLAWCKLLGDTVFGME